MSTDLSISPAIDVRTFWRTLGERATGMTIVTAMGAEGPAGFLGLSATHVTADPATILVSIDAKTNALAAVLSSRHFAVNYLPADAAQVADSFGGKAGVTGAARFREGEWDSLVTGAPIFSRALGAFDCRVDDVIQRGTISIIMGTAIGARSIGTGAPLVFFRGKTWDDLLVP